MKLPNAHYWIIPPLLILSAYFNNIIHPKALVVAGISALVIGAFSVKNHRKNIDEIQTYVLTFMILSVLSFLFSKTKNVGLDEITLEIAAVIIFLSLLNSRKWFKYFYASVATLISAEAIWAIVQQLTRPETRSAGSFLSQITNVNYFPNALGLFFVMTIPILWVTKKKHIAIPNLAITGLGIIGLILSFSRGAILAFMLSTFVILISFAFAKHYKKILGVVLTLIISATIAFGITQIRTTKDLNTNDIAEKASFGGTESITSVNERSDFFWGSLKIIKSKPLTGYGPNSFPYIYPQVQNIFLGNAPHPHNWILKIATERGVITLIPFIILVFTILVRSINTTKKQKNTSRVNSIIFLSALSTGFLHNLIDYNLNFTVNLLIFFMLTAIVVQRSAHKTINTKWNLSISVLITILIPLLVITTQNQFYIAQANSDDINKSINNLEKSYISYKDNYLRLSDLYIKQNEKEKAQIALEKMVKANRYHALALNKLGEVTADRTEAFEHFTKAIVYDPKNFFNYYVNYYNTALEIKKFELFSQDTEKIFTELNSYQELAKYNIHYTANTGNITEAIFLSKIFEKYGARDYKNKFQNITQNLIEAQKTFN